jgi:predicted kinase
MKLLVLIGISGSGKSFLAQQLESFDENFIRVSSDEIRKEMLGDVNNQNEGYKVFIKLEGDIERSLHYKNVIWDSTNLNWSSTKKSASKLADEKDIYYIFMMDSCNLELCEQRIADDLENNIDRSNVPLEVSERQYQRFMECKKNAINSLANNIIFYNNDFSQLISDIEEKWEDD